MSDPTDKICANCRAWETDAEEMGFCHRRAPAVVDVAGVAVWPQTRLDDSCEEFLPTPTYRQEIIPPRQQPYSIERAG